MADATQDENGYPTRVDVVDIMDLVDKSTR